MCWPVLVVMLAGSALAQDPAPTPALAKPARWKLLVLDVASADPADVNKGQGETLSSYIAGRAARFASLEVVSSADLRDLAKLEGEKQAAGCDEASASCLAEIAGALGADFVLSTRAGKLDAVYVVSLQLFDARVATAEGRGSVQGWTLAELPEKIGPVVDEILSKATGDKPHEAVVVQKVAGPAVTVDDTHRFGLQVGGGAAVLAGGIAIALGATPAILYGQKKDALQKATASFDGSADAIARASRVHDDAVGLRDLYDGVGRWGVLGGTALVIGGGAALAAGFFLPPPAPGASE